MTMSDTRSCEECGLDISARHGLARHCGDRCLGRAQAKSRKALASNTAKGRALRQRVYDRYGWACHICGGRIPFMGDPMTPEGPTVDHVIPLAKGGTDAIGNLRPAHRRCNVAKGASRAP